MVNDRGTFQHLIAHGVLRTRQSLRLDYHLSIPHGFGCTTQHYWVRSEHNPHIIIIMAKGLRSSTKKANRAKLRVEVFGPIEAARKVRLSAKLLDVASRSMPGIIKDSSMEAFDRGLDVRAYAIYHRLTQISSPRTSEAADKVEQVSKGGRYTI